MRFSNRDGFKFLYGGRISDLFFKINEEIKNQIERENEIYLLNVNEETYIDHISDKYKLDIPELHFEHVYADSYEADIPAELFPMSRFYGDTYSDKYFKKEVIQFYIPCTGDLKLLEYSPASIISLGGGGNGYFKTSGNNLVVEFINYSDKAEEIKTEFDRTINSKITNYNTLKKDIEEFNKTLKTHAKTIFHQQKSKFLKKNNLMASLGVPLKKREGVPQTFTVPQPQMREKIVVRPTVYEKGYKPEPNLDSENYSKILKIINDVGKNFERMPSIYKNKGEEDLRDHMLMTLDPNFEYGTTGGETFNKVGKTDIQLRFDSSVVFIAECKFWSGIKKFFETIDQLLSYLTWRDTKTSIIVFVRQKDISSILETIKNEISKHDNYLSFMNKSDENWFNYRFHLVGDKNREIKLAVQIFHLPNT